MKRFTEFKGVIFDMDGVIIQSEPHWHKVEAEFLRELIPTWTSADQDKILGMSMRDVHSKLFSEYGLVMPEEEYFNFYCGLANDLYGKRAEPTPGVLELIRELSKARHLLGVASSSPAEWIQITLNRFEITTFFKTIVSSDHVKGVGKPRPDIYLKAIKDLDLNINEICAIEDSSNGIKSAKAAGLYCFGLYNGFNKKEDLAECDFVLEGF